MKTVILSASSFLTIRVPRYEPTVETNNLPTPRAKGFSAEEMGAGLGQGLQKAANAAGDYYAEEKAKADRTATLAARTKLNQVENDLLYHPETGALFQRGKNAFGAVEPTLKSYDDKVAEIEQALSTEEQRTAFRQIAQSRRVDVDTQIQRHIGKAIQEYGDETNSAALSSTRDNISTHFDDPARVSKEMQFGEEILWADAESKGIPPESLKVARQAWRSGVHSTVIDRMSEADPIKASEYLKTNRDDMLPAEAQKREHALRPLIAKQEGMNTALELASSFATATDTVSIVKARNEALTQAQKRHKGNPDALNIAETQIKQMASDRDLEVKAERDAAAKPVYERIAKIQLSGRSAKLSDIPPDEWAALVRVNPEEAGKIQDSIRRELQSEDDRRERKSERAERKSEKESLNQLMKWAALNGDPDSLLKANLDKMVVEGEIGRKHYGLLSAKQSELRSDPDKGMAIRTENQVVEDILKGAKVKPGSDQHAAAWDYIERRKRAFSSESNRQPTRKELDEIARESLYKVDVAGAMFDKPAYQVTLKEIPKGDRSKITDALNRRGRPYTADEVIRLYVRKQMGGKK